MTCHWCKEEVPQKGRKKARRTSGESYYYHPTCFEKRNKTWTDIDALIEARTGPPKPDACRRGHVRTEENTEMRWNKTYERWYPHCLPCRRIKRMKV